MKDATKKDATLWSAKRIYMQAECTSVFEELENCPKDSIIQNFPFAKNFEHLRSKFQETIRRHLNKYIPSLHPILRTQTFSTTLSISALICVSCVSCAVLCVELFDMCGVVMLMITKLTIISSKRQVNNNPILAKIQSRHAPRWEAQPSFENTELGL